MPIPDYDYPSMLKEMEDPSWERISSSDFLAEREKRRQELREWQNLLTERERRDLEFATLYALCFEDHDTADGHLLILIYRLKDMLDSAVGFLFTEI